MAMGNPDGSHSPDVPVEPGTDMKKLMEYNPEFFFPWKIEEPWHVEVQDIKTVLSPV